MRDRRGLDRMVVGFTTTCAYYYQGRLYSIIGPRAKLPTQPLT